MNKQSVQIVANTNYPIGKIINQELQNSIDTQIAVAFLKQSGVNTIKDSLLMSLDKGGLFELIVGLDFKTTDPKAMKYFIDLSKQYKGVHFYCYGDKGENKNDIVFHPKIYLFRNPKEMVSIIGSTNLTQGGLMSNFEVNTIFNEQKPIYYEQLKAIYNSVKYTDSLFTPDEEYLYKYSDIFTVLNKKGTDAKNDVGVQKVIKELSVKEDTLPGTVPSIKLLLVEFLKQKEQEGVRTVSLDSIYRYMDERIKDPVFAGKFKLDTFHNTIRGELNHHELHSNDAKSMRLFERIEKGLYALTESGRLYAGR